MRNEVSLLRLPILPAFSAKIYPLGTERVQTAKIPLTTDLAPRRTPGSHTPWSPCRARVRAAVAG